MDRLGQFGFGGARCTERQSAAHRAFHRFTHVRMIVARDHRAPRAHVIDVALAFDVPEIRALGARGDEGFASHRFESAHRRVDAAGQHALRALEEFVIGAHAFSLGAKSAANCRAATRTSLAPNSAETTARKSVPASISDPPFSAVMPPIATRGKPNSRASRNKSSFARRAPGLVVDGKKAPNAR